MILLVIGRPLGSESVNRLGRVPFKGGGMLGVPIRGKKAILLCPGVIILKGSIAGALVVTFWVLGRKNTTGDNVLF